jgi:hypothetical protein
MKGRREEGKQGMGERKHERKAKKEMKFGIPQSV